MSIQHGSSWNDKNKIYAENTNWMWKAIGRYLISFKKINELFSLTEQKMKHLSWEVNVEYLRWCNKRWKFIEWNLKRIVVDIFKIFPFFVMFNLELFSCVFFLLPNFRALGKFFVFSFLHHFHSCFVYKFDCCCFEFHIVMSNEWRRDIKCSVRISSC